MWISRVLSSVIFLISIIVSIPLAFDIGGRTCGLAYSLSLSSFYFFYSLLRVTTPERSRFRYVLIQIIAWTQWLLLPSLLIWSLNKFSVDADNVGGWVERTFSGKRAQDVSVYQWLFGPNGLLETMSIGYWDKILRWSAPFFQLCEGFCSLLVIQAAGQITRWLVNKSGRTDTWMVTNPSYTIYGYEVGVITLSRLACLSCLHRSFQARSTSYGGLCNFQRLAMSTPH